jgi:hypothetical protein
MYAIVLYYGRRRAAATYDVVALMDRGRVCIILCTNIVHAQMLLHTEHLHTGRVGRQPVSQKLVLLARLRLP